MMSKKDASMQNEAMNLSNQINLIWLKIKTKEQRKKKRWGIGAHRILWMKRKFIDRITVSWLHCSNNFHSIIVKDPHWIGLSKSILGKRADIIFRCTFSYCHSIGKCYKWNAAAESKENDKCHSNAKDNKEQIKG